MAGSAVIVSLRVKADPERAFAVFTQQIGGWWRPNPLFRLTRAGDETLSFEPGPGGRLIAQTPDGARFTVGEISVWTPGERLVVSWRAESFAPDQTTQLEVRFEPVGEGETRVTVEHRGWDSLPADHAARHGFPLLVFQQREAEWWRAVLGRLAASAADAPPARATDHSPRA